jgi:transcriptional regulator GlxA family with amidase domain
LPTPLCHPGLREERGRDSRGSGVGITGALILASVGLLEGRQATTHWACYRVLESFGATYQRKRWVEDGKFITSAGVSAGIA